MRTKYILLLVVLVGIAGVGYYGMSEYGRGHRDTASVKPVHSVTAGELLAEFQQDEAAANAKYVGTTEQVIEVTGKVREVEIPLGGIVNVVLATGDDMAGIVCEFAEGTVPAAWRSGTEVKLKGICTGMLLDVVLVRCVPSS